MKHSLPLTLLGLLFYSLNLSAQNYTGNTVDNYSGINGAVYNPSNIVGTSFRADVNLISVSAFGGSDYFGINLNDILKSDGGFDIEEDSERFPTNSNNFIFSADVLGPSFMFNLNKKSSIGIITRARGFLNLRGINGELYETVVDDFDSDNDFDFDSSNLAGTIHVWGEIGLTYGRILIDKQQHMLKGGVTLKYLQGAGGLFISSPGLQGQYTAATENLTSQGSLNFGTTSDFDNNDVEFNNLTSGFGLDLGFTYEWHPNKEDEDSRFYQDPYKLKIGVSVTDIGSIDYKDADVRTYDMNASVSTATYDEDIEEFLDNNYNNAETGESFKLNLPTALHVLVDYRITTKFLVSGQASLSLVKENNELSNSIINTVTVMPRLETKWFSLFAPLSARQYGDVAFGAGFRLGPLSIGSGSVLSNLLSDSSKTTDVFVGLKIPVYRK